MTNPEMKNYCDSMREEMDVINADPELSKDQKHAYELATKIVLRIEDIPDSTQMNELEIMLHFQVTMAIIQALYQAIEEEEFGVVDKYMKAFEEMVEILVKDGNAHLN